MAGRPTDARVLMELAAQGAPSPDRMVNNSQVIGPQWFHFNAAFPDNTVVPVDLTLAANIADTALTLSLGATGNNPELSMVIDALYYRVEFLSETEAVRNAVLSSATLSYQPGQGASDVRVALGPYAEGGTISTDQGGQAAAPTISNTSRMFGAGYGVLQQPFAVDFQQGLFEMVPRVLVNNVAGAALTGDLWLHGYAWAGRAGAFLGLCAPDSGDKVRRQRNEHQRALTIAPRG